MAFSFLGYLIFIFLVGVISFRSVRNLDDFFIGGRRLGPWIVAISACASDMSAWLLLGLPGQAFSLGLGVIWVILGCLGGSLFNWKAISVRLKEFTTRYSILTIPEFFASKFPTHSLSLRITSLLIIIFFYTAYVSSQMVGVGKVLSASFNWPYWQALLIGSGVLLLYIILGGFIAVCWTDFFQGILMVLALVILPIIGIVKLGGISNLFQELNELSLHHNLNLLSWTGGKSGLSLYLGLILGSLSIGLGYPGQPHILMRFMAIRERRKLKESMYISLVWLTLSLTGATFIGLLGRVYLREVIDPEKITSSLAYLILPSWLVGVLISAIVAAIMSTVDSQLLVVSSSVIEDIGIKIMKKKLSYRREVLIGRLITLGVGVFALLFALNKENHLVYWLVLYAWGGLAASLGPALIMALLYKNVHPQGIIAGMLSGLLTIIIWANIPVLKSIIYELFPAFFISLGIIYWISKVKSRRNKR